ncbi:MAG TPA: carbonic anhydrase [Arachidicoccus sp.]|nr:carbonic anhydrase [Arachidicoccus sp.]
MTILQIKENVSTPQGALQLLKDGNRRFTSNTRMNRNYQENVIATKDGQYPFAAILSCMDSRAPAELVFDQGIGDIFNIRIAGNIISGHVLGSLEYAVEVAHTPLIVILAHTKCGAISGACDQVQLGNLTGLLDKISPAVQAEQTVLHERNSQNPQFLEKVTAIHVENVRREMLAESSLIREAEQSGRIRVETAIYDVETGIVKFKDQYTQKVHAA